LLTIGSEEDLQRLFSTFASGWPGVGLLLQRILTAVLLIRFVILDLVSSSFSFSLSAVIEFIAALTGILFLIGLWTPIMGALIALVELWSAMSHVSDPSIHLTLAVLGATIAMIGPGAWSMDARLFGRKHIEA
jgi:putative oxidoreductase